MGGVDLQLLGLGHDGHIGFNEPNDEFDKETHCVDLTEMTIEANKRFFNSIDEVPRQALSLIHIYKTSFAATALAVSSHVPYNRHRRLEK